MFPNKYDLVDNLYQQRYSLQSKLHNLHISVREKEELLVEAKIILSMEMKSQKEEIESEKLRERLSENGVEEDKLRKEFMQMKELLGTLQTTEPPVEELEKLS
mmetsp:Transcript_20697/g.18345  ORF Transcript_20697/g.18345 Transcript_20697/m.18345 type:complete len:103 (+) Transcript_20697:171-479(+)